MLRCLSLVSALAAAAPAMASPLADYPDEPLPDAPVLIEVAPNDLERCRATLALVLTPVMVDENGQPMLALPAGNATHPDVRCVVAQG